VLVNVGATPTLLLNQGGNHNHRVLFKLVGTKSNKSAIGARVTVKTGKVAQVSEVRAGGKLHFTERSQAALGLGSEVRMTGVEIKWPSGKVGVLRDVPADFIYTIVEGQGHKGQDSATVAIFAGEIVRRGSSSLPFHHSSSHSRSVGLCLSVLSFSHRAPRAIRSHPYLCSSHGLHRFTAVVLLRFALLVRHRPYLAIACARKTAIIGQLGMIMEEREFFDERPEKKMQR